MTKHEFEYLRATQESAGKLEGGMGIVSFAWIPMVGADLEAHKEDGLTHWLLIDTIIGTSEYKSDRMIYAQACHKDGSSPYDTPTWEFNWESMETRVMVTRAAMEGTLDQL